MTVTIDGQPCNMFIDTGALGVILNSKHFDHNINGHVMGSGGRGVDWQQVTSLSIDGTHHFLHKGGIVVLPLGVVGQVSSFDYFDFMKKLPQKDMKKQKKKRNNSSFLQFITNFATANVISGHGYTGNQIYPIKCSC